MSILISQKGIAQNKAGIDSSYDSSRTLLSTLANSADITLVKVRELPEFPGGQPGWESYLKSCIKKSIPLINKAPTGNYNISIRYTVWKDGSLKNVGANSNCGYGMEAEVIRCLNACPKWQPARTSSKEIVNFATKQLVVFKIKGNEIEVEIR